MRFLPAEASMQAGDVIPEKTPVIAGLFLLQTPEKNIPVIQI
jgi:hypothetical protein